MPEPAPALKLSNGVEIPALGLGTWPRDDAEAEAVVAGAIRSGYRLIDTAEGYSNEARVGRGMRASGVDRSEVFVTTKWWFLVRASRAFGSWDCFRLLEDAGDERVAHRESHRADEE